MPLSVVKSSRALCCRTHCPLGAVASSIAEGDVQFGLLANRMFGIPPPRMQRQTRHATPTPRQRHPAAPNQTRSKDGRQPTYPITAPRSIDDATTLFQPGSFVWANVPPRSPTQAMPIVHAARRVALPIAVSCHSDLVPDNGGAWRCSQSIRQLTPMTAINQPN